MKNQLLISCLLVSIFELSAQENTLSSGGEATGTGGNASYSIGQIAYENSSNTTGNVNQGLQQPYEIFVLEVIDASIEIELSVFPNPTADYLILKMGKLPNAVRFTLYDENGKLLTDQPVLEKESKIKMSIYSNGSYQLQITQDNKTIKRIQIIKQN